jgi:hypothetical protein
MAKLSWLAAALICGSWATATAQNAISAKAGLVQVADGEVFVNDTAIHNKVAEFTDLKNTDVLRTAEGRAEVLLTPGAFVRMGDNSSLRMVSSRLSDVRLEVLQGEALVEITELLTDNAISVTLGNANFELTRGGIFGFAADPARLRVYKGEAVAALGEKQVRVKEGHELAFTGSDWTQSSFDAKDIDALYRWSQRRAENIAVANVSAARQSGNSFDTYASNGYPSMGFGYGGYGMGAYGMGAYGGYGIGGYGGYGMGGYGGYGAGWMYNPYFGMYTFLPFYGTAFSPFGYAFYTPITVVPVYANTPVTPITGKPGGRTITTASAGNAVRTPAFTSAAGLRTGAVTHGAMSAHSWSGGSSGYRNGSGGHYSSSASTGGYYSSSSSSMSSVSSASSGHMSSAAGSSGGGGHASH